MNNQPPTVRVGDVIAGKYSVERVLGEGAMGMVVAAMHVELQERRAIKIMLPTHLDNTESYERFLREARAPAKLKSNHVTRVHDVGRTDDGTRYIVLEYLEGTDLNDLLNDRNTLPVDEAVGYLLQACEAIGEAHRAGIVHRDLKPANLFLTTGVGGAPCIKVLDFGIAKISAPEGFEQNNMTGTATMMGTPYYMSPEQIKSSRSVDGRADIWSLGVILFRMVTGQLPFIAMSQGELFANILTEAPAIPSQLNPRLSPAMDAIILRCMEKDVTKRWQNVGELVTALRPHAQPQVAQEVDGTAHLWRGSAPSIPSNMRPASPSSPGGTMMMPQLATASPPRFAAPMVPTMQGIAPPPARASHPSVSALPPYVQTANHPAVQTPIPQPMTSSGNAWPSPVLGSTSVMDNGVIPSTIGNGLSQVVNQQDGQPKPAPRARGIFIGIAVGALGALLIGLITLIVIFRGGDGAAKEKDAVVAASAVTSSQTVVRDVAFVPSAKNIESPAPSASVVTTTPTTRATVPTKKTVPVASTSAPVAPAPAPRPTNSKSSGSGLYGEGM